MCLPSLSRVGFEGKFVLCIICKRAKRAYLKNDTKILGHEPQEIKILFSLWVTLAQKILSTQSTKFRWVTQQSVEVLILNTTTKYLKHRGTKSWGSSLYRKKRTWWGFARSLGSSGFKHCSNCLFAWYMPATQAIYRKINKGHNAYRWIDLLIKEEQEYFFL